MAWGNLGSGCLRFWGRELGLSHILCWLGIKELLLNQGGLLPSHIPCGLTAIPLLYITQTAFG